jgi:oligoendopeptidase F
MDYSTDIERKMNQLATYASLRHSEDSREEASQLMFSKAYAKSVQINAMASFAEPEILSLSDEQLNTFVEAPELAPYRFKMETLRRQKPHVLSAEEEKILTGIGEIVAAPGEISDMLLDADMTFDSVTDSKGNTVPVTQAGFISLQSSKDRNLRKASFQSYYKGFKNHINTFGTIYAANVKADVFKAKTRHFSGARAMSMASENIPESVYDGLIETVHKHMPAMYRYVRLRKKILGLDELHYYDLYTPLAKEVDLTYTYEEAQKMVLQATAPLGKAYTEVVQKAFDERWIDVYPNVGKSGGAFSSGTYDSAPYIMLNYTGTVDSVSTIAHEMGHSMHSYLSHANQPPQYAYYEIFVAEVASTVNENLMIEQLLAQDIEAPMRLYLLNQYLENFKGTVYRQTMFAEFEKIAHERVEAGEALSAEGLCQIYENLVKLYFGDGLVMDPEVRYEWARIPHFYRSFYVYKYATSYAAAVALSDGILKNGEKAVKPYLEFLSLGGSMDPLDSLHHAGIDMTTSDPIDRALEKFESILDETEKVYNRVLGSTL